MCSSPASSGAFSASASSAAPASTGSSSMSSGVGRVRPDPPRRSRSQGTRKLHKCLSTASYSEDCGSLSGSYASAGPGGFACAGVPSHAANTLTPGAGGQQRQHQLLVARQYCSFGSTVTDTICFLFFTNCIHTY